MVPGKREYPHIFLISPRKHVKVTHEKCLNEALLVVSQHIFHGKIRKYHYFLVEKKRALSGAMIFS